MGLYYYTNNGTKIKPEHNKDFYSYNLYLQFTDDNRIIVVYGGFETKKINEKYRNTWYSDLPNQDSEVFLVDPEQEKIVWTTKLSSEPTFQLGILSKQVIYPKDDKVFLFDSDLSKKVLEILCLDINSGKVLWKSRSPDFFRPNIFVADDNWIYTVHYFMDQTVGIYRIEIKTGKMEKMNEYPRAYEENPIQLEQINDVLFLYSKEGYYSTIVNIARPNGKIEEMDGFIKSNKGNINYINGNKIYRLKKKNFN